MFASQHILCLLSLTLPIRTMATIMDSSSKGHLKGLTRVIRLNFQFMMFDSLTIIQSMKNFASFYKEFGTLLLNV